MQAVDAVIPLPPRLRIQAGPGETVYSFAARLERHLHASEGAIRSVAYVAAARGLKPPREHDRNQSGDDRGVPDDVRRPSKNTHCTGRQPADRCIRV